MANPSPLVPAEDPLWVALVRVLSFYKVRPQKELIEAQVAVDWSQPLAPKDLMLIAHQLGFEVVVQSMAGIDIKALLKPALIMMPPGAQFVVTVPQENGDPDIWSPDPVDIDGLLASTQRNLYAMQFGRRFAVASDEEAAEASKTIAPWFWNIVWQHNRDYLDLGLATFFVNIIALVSPLFSMNVFDRVVPNHANETLFALTIGIVLAYIFNFGFKYIRDHILGIITTRIAVRLDIDFMDQLLRLSVPAHKQTVGEKFDLFHEMQGLRDFFAARLMPAIVDMPFFVLFLGVMFLIAPPVGVIVLIGVILLVVVNLALRPAVKRTAKAHYKDTRSKNAALVELISGASSIRMFNAIGFTLFRWGNLSERVAGSSRTSIAKTSLADDLSAMIMYLTSVFVIVAGVLSIESGDLSLGGLVACNMLVGRTMAPVMGLIAVFGRLRQSLDSLKTIDAIFHLPAEPKLTLDYETKGPFKGRMRFDDITFYHPGQVHPTLYHLSLDIRPGEKVGLIGRTGAGKSTLLGLLDGSIKPQSGHVFADEIIMDAIHPTEWRQSLGLVPQNPFIFSGTVRENILLGLKDNVEDAWLKQVLSMAGLDVLLQSAGYGLDFKVGEAGIRLSGGQRQSLALARALIRRPQILLMDEPTNGMDNDLEQRVMNNLRGYLADKTMMMVTHRTPLLALVDRLVLIDQGRVVADGPRDDVMRKLSGTAHG